MATRSKQAEEAEQDVERDEEFDEEQDGQDGGGGMSLRLEGDMMIIELPRDGNESDTLQRLAKFADGL